MESERFGRVWVWCNNCVYKPVKNKITQTKLDRRRFVDDVVIDIDVAPVGGGGRQIAGERVIVDAVMTT